MKIDHEALERQKTWIEYYERMIIKDGKSLLIHKEHLANNELKLNYDELNRLKNWIEYYERMIKYDRECVEIHKKRLARVEKGEKLDDNEF